MSRLQLRAVVLISVLAVGCGSKSPTAPSGGGSSTPTRIITVAGDLAFGSVNIGESSTKTFTISNSGTATLTFTSLSAAGGTGTSGYTASPTSGTVPAGGSVTVTLRFTPTTAGFLSHVLTVVGDQTSGNAAINVSGTGVNPNPIFTKSGTGDTVFDMPTYVKRVTITGRYTRSSSNFIVRIGGRLIVNELLGTSWSQVDFSGTYSVSGGETAITSSSGVDWTFTEVR